MALSIIFPTGGLCTGSLISPTFVITAAHCTDYIPTQGKLEKNKQCVEETAAGRNFHIYNPKKHTHFTLQCKIVTTFEGKKKIRNLEIVSLDPVGMVQMGATDLSNLTQVAELGKRSKIKRAILPERAYQGSGYGQYGGYDIALIELEQPMNFFHRACLPSPSFDDQVDSKLAGYGMYFRQNRTTGQDVCQTNQYGQMKYHYCRTECSTKKSPPSSPACKSFFRYHSVPEDKEEVLIRKSHGWEFCFRNENKENKEVFHEYSILLILKLFLFAS